MTRLTPRMIAAASGAIVLAAGVVVGFGRFLREGHSPCGAGFARSGARCLVGASSSAACPAPLVRTEHGCDAAEHDVVAVPGTSVLVGPSDWEAEGRVTPRTVVVRPFAIDCLEVTVGRACASAVFAGAPFCEPKALARDPARAAFGVGLAKARSYCSARGGRLPTADEWLAAAGGDRPRRYPWGDTGAVCRRAAWGLSSGPCADGADGPDTVGAHPDGATPLGIHDLAGNVAEWVESTPNPLVLGGSWQTGLATELRTWAQREVPPGSEDRGIGFRCAYDQVPSSVR